MSAAHPWLAAVIVVVVREGRVLSLRRAAHKVVGAGRWETVAGRIEHGEEPMAAAIRETAEECGLRVTVRERPVDAYVAPYAEGSMLAVVFRADVEEDGGEVRLSAEHDDFGWLTAEEIAERGSWPRLIEAIERAIAAE